ncbi:hypothetical protein BJ912DRAFT_1148946 [Pholiota molesta]|nr:hypothetical protein BJ912DRAFT_1148946 [Pholiota molesta]
MQTTDAMDSNTKRTTGDVYDDTTRCRRCETTQTTDAMDGNAKRTTSNVDDDATCADDNTMCAADDADGGDVDGDTGDGTAGDWTAMSSNMDGEEGDTDDGMMRRTAGNASGQRLSAVCIHNEAAIAASAVYRRLNEPTPATDPRGFRDPRNPPDPLPKPAETHTLLHGWRVARNSLEPFAVGYDDGRLNGYRTTLQIAHNILALSFGDKETRTLIWDWTTSELLLDSAISFDHSFQTGLGSRSLLNSTHLLSAFTDNSGSIRLYKLERSLSVDNAPAVHLATLHLPSLAFHRNCKILSITIQTEPILAHPLPHTPFMTNDEDRLHRVFTKYILRHACLGGPPLDIPWAEWGPSNTRLIFPADGDQYANSHASMVSVSSLI